MSRNEHPHEKKPKASNGSAGGVSGNKMVPKVQADPNGNRAERRAAKKQ